MNSLYTSELARTGSADDGLFGMAGMSFMYQYIGNRHNAGVIFRIVTTFPSAVCSRPCMCPAGSVNRRSNRADGFT